MILEKFQISFYGHILYLIFFMFIRFPAILMVKTTDSYLHEFCARVFYIAIFSNMAQRQRARYRVARYVIVNNVTTATLALTAVLQVSRRFRAGYQSLILRLKKTTVLNIWDGNPKTALARSCKQVTEKSLGLVWPNYIRTEYEPSHEKTCLCHMRTP